MSLLSPTMISYACPSISSFKVVLLSSKFFSRSSLSLMGAGEGGHAREPVAQHGGDVGEVS